ncbi:MAG: ATP-binding cassette domain-containing protein [Clostridiales bacterium]|jgi:ATP-binding cassette subfamily F protein 3|nr:ATP-binding cassette domain-containing protein [Clostridiales bacterium]
MILSCQKISKSFSGSQVLKDISFIIEEKEKVALVGVNGAGKTTLFRIITGELAYDGGGLSISKDLKKVGYLSQLLDLDNEKTIYNSLLEVFEDILDLEHNIRECEKIMSEFTGAGLEKIMDRYSKLTAGFEESNGYEIQSRVKGVIKGLGFQESDYGRKVGILSGGQKSRVSLGKLLLSNPGLLLLDEPTNHLDIESIEWLEEFLKNYDGAVLLISHDRYFINKVAGKIIELENGRSAVYYGGYAHYAKRKGEDRAIKVKQYLDQQKEIKRQEEVIRVLKSYNREKSIKRAESREKLLAKVERLDKPEALPENMRLKIIPKIESGNDVLDVLGVGKSFGGQKIFESVSFSIKKQEKIALIGPNGVGKTTLIKIIMESLMPDSGLLKKGVNVHIGYYDQEHKNLNLEKPVFDDVYDDFPKLTVLEVRNALAAFLFTGDDVFKTVNDLSGGEKGRVSLAKIMLSKANFLILDEPTNHLDLYSKEILEESIRNYEGTVLYISHDRYFINNTADKILELTKTGVNLYMGNYDYYMEKKKAEPVIKVEAPEKKAYNEKRQSQSDGRKRRTKLRNLESEISSIENEIKVLDGQLMDGKISSDHVLLKQAFDEKSKLEDELLILLEEWEGLQG